MVAIGRTDALPLEKIHMFISPMKELHILFQFNLLFIAKKCFSGQLCDLWASCVFRYPLGMGNSLHDIETKSRIFQGTERVSLFGGNAGPGCCSESPLS